MFGKKKRVRADTFNMSMNGQAEAYENILDNVHNGKDGWSIIEKEQYKTDQGFIISYLEWTEPVSNSNG